ncbi:AgmX/PglI C-terminal domain-containing protein [bacterium]|nr:AgmX/PglI C-terminal domain-containing protein [bacterium]
MAQAMTFPKELEKNFFRDMDRFFAGVSVITFLVCVSFTGYMQSLPVRPLTAEDVLAFNQAIYRTQIKQETAPVAPVSDAGSQATSAEDTPVEEAEEEAPAREITQAERDAARAQARAVRQARAQAKIAAIAARLKTLTGPTARGRGSRRGATARRAVKLTSGGGGSGDIKDALALVGDASGVARVKQLRGGGAISEDIGDFDISDLRGFLSDPSNLDAMLNEAKIKLSKKSITAKGGLGTKRKQRSPGVVSQIIQQNKNQVVYCYWTYKRRDSSLKGQVMIEFTVAPDGNVIAVNFRKSKWGGNPLRKDVEKCIKNVIMQWRFAPIDKKDGNVKFTTTFMLQ